MPITFEISHNPELIHIIKLHGKTEQKDLETFVIYFNKQLNNEPKFISTESPTALLSDASQCFKLFGNPSTSLNEMVSAIAKWVKSGKTVLGKPTRYEIRNGKF